MSEFSVFNAELQQHIKQLYNQHDAAFVTDVSGYVLWDLYLESFPPGANEVYRERREYDCNCCKQFVRKFGNAVFITSDYSLVSIWDFDTSVEIFKPVLAALSERVRAAEVIDRFFSVERTISVASNYEISEKGEQKKWEHLHTDLPRYLVYSGSSLAAHQATFRDSQAVFFRSLVELTPESLDVVLDLISQRSLYKGEEWESALKEFATLQKEFLTVPDSKRKLFSWYVIKNMAAAISRIRNHSIGTLLIDLSGGMDVDLAVTRYEKVVAPTNYKRPKEIFTQRMVEQARAKVEELGYLDSLGRRFAILEDISVANTIFANSDARKRMPDNVFDVLSSEAKVVPKRVDRVEEISIDRFIVEVLPRTTSLEVLFENAHVENLVSLIAPKVADAPTMFKWGNAFSWAYNGNITDSMKERVKAAGGNVAGDLRFSIQWNAGNDYNPNDFDAWCMLPGGGKIYYARPRVYTGYLDVDIRRPRLGEIAVENIAFPSVRCMKAGKYEFMVHNFSHNGGRSGFSAEVEFAGQIHTFSHTKELRQNEVVKVATVLYDGEKFSITPHLPSDQSQRTVWGLTTQQFVPVTIMTLSPNYWDGQNGVGHKHYFFMLCGAVNDTCPNGFFNEFLQNDLLEHKRVFAALGSQMKVEPSQEQLSGIGFSSTKRSSVVCKVEGAISRILKVVF